MDRKACIQLLVIFAVIKTLLHLYTNLFAGYGIFRDELYYLACTEHLDYGYVDHPPLSIWVLAVVKALFGKSVFAIRLLPAILSGLVVLIAGLITYELGGRRTAISLVGLALLVSPIHMAYGTFYSMNVIDLFLWALALYFVVKLLKTEENSYWIYLGIILGLALLNKIGALFFGAGLFTAILFFRRKWLATKWPYITGVISLGMFIPYVIWNIQHDWAHLEFIHNASTIKYASMTRGAFWTSQFIIYNPVTIPVWICGLLYLFTAKENQTYRFIFIIFLVVALILTINRTSKPEYLAAIFPVMLIGGALKIEEWSASRKWISYATMILVTSGIIFAPLALPILPVDTYIRYAAVMPFGQDNSEGKAQTDVSQFYADMFGWEEKAAALAKAYRSLTPEEQKVCVIHGDNYGRAGAVDYYREKYDLPKSIGNHNNYWIWGPGETTGKIVLILSDEVGDKAEIFESVEDLGVVTCNHCMPYENNLHIYLCRGLKRPVHEVWQLNKSFI